MITVLTAENKQVKTRLARIDGPEPGGLRGESGLRGDRLRCLFFSYTVGFPQRLTCRRATATADRIRGRRLSTLDTTKPEVRRKQKTKRDTARPPRRLRIGFEGGAYQRLIPRGRKHPENKKQSSTPRSLPDTAKPPRISPATLFSADCDRMQRSGTSEAKYCCRAQRKKGLWS